MEEKITISKTFLIFPPFVINHTFINNGFCGYNIDFDILLNLRDEKIKQIF